MDATNVSTLTEVCEAAILLPHGYRVQVTDPQAFREEFEQLRTISAPKFDALYLRAAPMNAHEIWILKRVSND